MKINVKMRHLVNEHDREIYVCLNDVIDVSMACMEATNDPHHRAAYLSVSDNLLRLKKVLSNKNSERDFDAGDESKSA